MPIVCPTNSSSPVHRDEASVLALNEPEADPSTTLLEELQHRIRNDLHSILGCIEREQRRTTNAQQGRLLDELTERLWCLAGIYDLLHARSNGLIDLGEYLLLLCTRIRTGALLQSTASQISIFSAPLPPSA